MRLPGLDRRRVDPAKIARYLLNLDHPEGGSKARFFIRFGFDPEVPSELRQALLDHGCAYEVTRVADFSPGRSYVIEGPLRTPDGRHPRVRSVWMSGPDGAPYLVTAYPCGRR